MGGRHRRRGGTMIAALIVTGLTAGVLGGWLREPAAPTRPLARTQPAAPRASPAPKPEAGPVSVVFVPPRVPVGRLSAAATPRRPGGGTRTRQVRPRCPEGLRRWPLFWRWCAQHGYDVR